MVSRAIGRSGQFAAAFFCFMRKEKVSLLVDTSNIAID
jgi:hypothetical protein